MPKKLVIFCDGTWNDLRMSERTNVSRLAKCVAPRARDNVTPQVVFYDEGVGVGSDVSRVADEAVKLVGGAFGRGLDRKIEAAYRFLVTNYEVGDDIYVFGFSRGAYTARSLCGLVRKCGILRRDCFDLTPKALELYRNEKHPRSAEMIEFRATYTHPVAAGPEDFEHLGIRAPEPRSKPDRFESLAELYQYRPERTYRMMFLGVWDTVGSLGVPDRFGVLSHLTNKKYAFHDTAASSLLASLRHAAAIDEERRVFSSTGFDNIDQLNETWASHTGWDVLSPNATGFVPYHARPYQQLWFPGDHGAVGGGNPEPGLSSITLLWIAQGAERAGLNLVHNPGSELAKAFQARNPCADWRVNKDGTRRKAGKRDMLGQIGGYRPRTGPGRLEEAAPTTYERWCRLPAYRPANLTVLAGLPCPPPSTDPPPTGFPPSD
jgi:uncharacterized protein (DUF2235 family)